MLDQLHGLHRVYVDNNAVYFVDAMSKHLGELDNVL